MAYEPEEIIVDFLRRRITDPRSTSRHTATSDTFSGTGSVQTLTLTPTSGNAVQVVTGLTATSVSKKKYQDYDYDLRAKTVTGTFTSGTANVVVSYDEGTTDWIYSDDPYIELAPSSYPRIRVWKTDENGDRQGSEATSTPAPFVGDCQFQVDIYVRNDRQTFTIGGKVYVNEALLQYLARQVIEAFRLYVDDLYPKLHDIRILSSRPFPFDKDRQAFRWTILFSATSSVIGQ
jgi:hypothetical protein